MKKLKRLVLGSTVGLVGLGLPAMAQTNDAAKGGSDSAAKPPSLETVIVTGVRASLESAVNVKRNADQIVDAVSAEDLGKFPVQNLAESLQHITGVQISRSNGEGNQVSIRGLDPQFNRVLYNGRELTSPTGDRSFSFANLAPTFIASLEAYKTPSADLAEGGLAGTINVSTPNPLDIGKRTIVGTLSATRASNGGSTQPRVSLLYNDVNADKSFGISVGYDRDHKPVYSDAYQAFGVWNIPMNTFAPVYGPGPGAANPSMVAGLNAAMTYGSNIGDIKRDNAVLTMQLRPSKDFEAKFDVLYSKSREHVNHWIMALRPVNLYPSAQYPQPGTYKHTITNGVLNYVEMKGVDHRNNMREINYDDSIFSPALSARYRTGAWTLSGEVSRSEAKRETSTLSLDVIGRAWGIMDMGQDWSEPAVLAYGPGFNALDPKGFRVLDLDGDYKRPNSETSNSLKLDAKYETGNAMFPNLSVGTKFTRGKEDVGSSIVFANAEVLARLLGASYDPSNEGGSFDGSPYMVQFNQPRFSTAPSTYLSGDYRILTDKVPLDKILAASPPTHDLSSTYTVKEDTKAIYGKLDFELMGGKLNGNVGLRVVRTHQVSSGYSPDLSKIQFTEAGARTIIPETTPVTVSRDYTNVLPSLNARYELHPSHVLRLGLARVMARPNLKVLAPNTTVNANVSNIAAGNPEVKPFISDQFDLAYEWYLGKGGLLSLTGFYKDVQNFLVNTTRSVDLTVIRIEGGTRKQTFSYNAPANGASSTIKGLEFGYQQPFTFLPGELRNTGVVLAYTFVDAGKTRVVEGGPALALPGVSRKNYNLTGYYDNGTLEARVSYSFRDKFVNDNFSYFGDGELTKAYSQIDLSASYKFTQTLWGFFNVLNVTDSAVSKVTYNDVNRGKEYAGRRYTLGMNLKF